MLNENLELIIREAIRREGPMSFARFMAEALYHPGLGYYSSGRCTIGRRGDYFTSVSVGPLFGRLLAAQFAEVWEKLERPEPFTIVEQGAHHGELASDLLEALRATRPDVFAAVRYRIVEPFPLLQRRQEAVLRPFAAKMEWAESIKAMPSFCGLHFSNELIDALPVHLLVAEAGEWRERLVERTSDGFTFVERPLSDPRLRARLAKMPAPPNERYETEVNLAALDWIEALAPRLERGIVLAADYGFIREEYYAPGRKSGTLQSYAGHHVLPSPLERVGECDLSAHVEWTSLAEAAEACGLTIAGFTDQHHFLTGLLASDPALAAAASEKSRALQTLLHPEFLGTKFQFLALARNFPGASSLGGFKFARPPRSALAL